MADYKERAREREKQRKQSVWFKLAEGENTFRMLPTPKGTSSGPVFTEYAVHREVGPKKVTVRCGKDVDGEGDCWLCDKKIPVLRDKGLDARAEALAPRDVLMIQVAKYDVESEKFSGPFLFTPSKTLGDSLLRLIGSKKRTYEDPKKGFNLTVNRTGTGRNDTRYSSIETDEDPMPVDPEIIKKLKPFDQLKEIPEYSEAAQKAAYQGIEYVAPEDDEEAAPRTRTRKPAAPESEDEEETTEEDDESVDEPDEEDESEPPTPKKKKAPLPPAKVKKTKPEPEEEEEVEDEEELDDEAADEDVEEEETEVEDEDGESEDEDLEDEEEAPAPKKKPAGKPVPATAKKKAKPAEDEDEEELDDIDLDDLPDDEPDSPPAKKKPAGKPAPVPAKKTTSSIPVKKKVKR